MAKPKPPTRKRGRPPLPADQVKRVPLNMRTTPEVRAKIESAAKRSGRSLAQQVEWLIEDALRGEEAKYEEFLGYEYYRLGLVLVSAIHEAERISGQRWYETPELLDKAAAFLVSFLDGYGRTFGKGPGASSKMDYHERLKRLRGLAEEMKPSGPPTQEK